MKTINRLPLIIIGLFISISSCKKEKVIEPATTIENPGPNKSAAPAVLDLGNTISADFFARIVDEDDIAVKNAIVKVGGKTALTDENGIAILKNANVPEKLAYLTVLKSGYFLGSRSVLPQSAEMNEIRIMLLKKEVFATIYSGEETTVATTSGLKIDFKGEYVKSNGELYSGTVNVAIKHINPDSDNFSDEMPGSLYAQNESNNPGVLESYGMGAIEIFTPSGEELQIAEGSKATMRMPVSPNQIADAPSTIPLWHFDEIAGYWIEEGEATLINGEYVGEVKHFSFWNCDAFYDDATISGNFVGINGNPIGYGFFVEIVTPNASTSGSVYGSGTFSSYVPANVPVTFNVFDDCNNLFASWSHTFVTNSSVSHTFVNSGSYVVAISGILVDCNNNAVTNGYVSISIGNYNFFPTLNSNGQFSVFYDNNCNTSTHFTIEGNDYTNLQTTGTLTYSLTYPHTNIGSMIACSSVNEYITYSIDNGPPNSYFTPITCTELNNPSYKISVVSTNPTNGYIHLRLQDNALGTYLSTDYDLAPYGGHFNAPEINDTINIQNIVFNLTSYGSVGDYVDIDFSGTFIDQSQVQRNIAGTVHVIRDL